MKHGNATHDMTGTRIYNAWLGMKARCKYTTSQCYQGIKVCKRWMRFENFLHDMGPHPGPGFTLDRKNSRKDYCPSNCRWATPKEQSRNTSKNRFITINGATLTHADWCERYGISQQTLAVRINRLRWNPIEAVITPVDPKYRNHLFKEAM